MISIFFDGHEHLSDPQNIFFIFLLLTACVSGASMIFFLFHSRFDWAYYCFIFALCLIIPFSYGQDSVDHAARLFEISRHFQNGDLDLFTFMGDASLPTFYFYSPALYLFSMPLKFLGLSEYNSIHFVALIFFSQMALCLPRLLENIIRTYDKEVAEERSLSFISAFFFLASNYIYSNFLVRAAYAEAASHSLIPLVLLLLHKKKWVAAVLFIALQICLHPPVIMQSSSIVLVTHLLFFTRNIRDTIYVVLCYAAAVLITMPSWLWAFANRDAILGISGLPEQFEDTFVSLLELANPSSFNTIGPYLIVFATFCFFTTRRINAFAAVTLTIGVVTLLMQSTVLKQLTIHLPLVDIGLFIWRWMIVSAWFFMLTVLLTYRMENFRRLMTGLLILAGAQAIGLSALQVRPAPDINLDGYFQKVELARFWARSEFFPSYFAEFAECDATELSSAQIASSRVLMQAGVASDKDVAIFLAPTVGTQYFWDETISSKRVCGPWLIIAHPQPGQIAQLSVKHDIILSNPEIRLFIPYLYLALCLISLGMVRLDVFERRRKGAL